MSLQKMIFLFLIALLSWGTLASPPLTGKKVYDAHFLDKMTEHDRDGIALAEMAKEKSVNERIQILARQMIEVKKKEIKQMDKWRTDLYADVPMSKERPKRLDLSGLKSLRGEGFDTQFLTLMSRHHEAGIRMCDEAQRRAANAEIRKFATKATQIQAQEEMRMGQLKHEQ